MPINFQWRPSNKPPTNDQPDVIGLELGGDDPGLPAPRSRGRIRLIEVPGPNEPNPERLIATFWGNWRRDATSPPAQRVTFEVIFDTRKQLGPFDGELEGFDPECIFGVDAFVFTFVNRRFVVWLPFYVDTQTEGRFLEIVAVAEVPSSATAFREIGRSAVLNLGIRRNHRVASTTLSNNAPVTYTANLVGNMVTATEEFLLEGQVAVPGQTTLAPRFLPVPATGGGDIRFAAYPANSMRIMLTTNLLDALTPTGPQLSSRVTTLPNPGATAANVSTEYRQRVPATVSNIFTDAGFTGVQVFWQDEPAASVLDRDFRTAFTLDRNRWRLLNAAAPWRTGFWNFVAANDSTLQGAIANGETHPVATATPRNVAGTQAFIAYTVPIGAGTKPVSAPIRIIGSRMLDLLLNSGGTARTFPDETALIAAVDRSAAHVGIIVAHEVGHALGLMHTPHVEGGDYSEANGSPVLTIMSEGVDSGGFGTNMHFSAQVKVMWSQVFTVTPNFVDTTLQNKTWTTAEVTTVTWAERTNRFLRQHGESGMRVPPWSIQRPAAPPPPFAVAPPGKQRGTP